MSDMGLAREVMLLALAFMLGFAASRSGICAVKAVDDWLSKGRPGMFISFLKISAWVVLITLILTELGEVPRDFGQGYAVHPQGLFFAALFGIGAVINGGCAMSALAKLGRGELAMGVAMAGMAIGAVAGGLLLEALPQNAQAPRSSTLIPFRGETARYLLVVLSLWAVWELVRLWRRRSGHPLWQRLMARAYAPDSGALIIGGANAIIFAEIGAWAYTGTLSGAVTFGLLHHGLAPPPLLWALFAAALIGASVTAWQTGGIHVAVIPRKAWMKNFVGGAMMGVALPLIPGGNDELILHTIPMTSPHALPAWGAMLVGILAARAVLMALARSAKPAAGG